jgi:very-short-patch-repair endonuclease
MLEYNVNLKAASRELRNHMTEAELLLWSRIRKRQLLDIQFYRQKPIGSYVVDFYAPAAKIVIEVDGSQHLEPEYMQRDEARDQYMADEGLSVLRFSNVQVLCETDVVVERILDVIRERL